MNYSLPEGFGNKDYTYEINLNYIKRNINNIELLTKTKIEEYIE
jgi:hypothetical protein